MEELKSVKAGDSLWVGVHAGERRRIEKVSSVTPTQIVTGTLFGGTRYLRKNGLGYGRRNYFITGIATEKEIQEYEAKLASQREESSRRAEAEKQIDDKRKELNALFDGIAFVRLENDKWIVEFQPATESAVRQLAELVTR
jgi:hypothetical protein